MNCPNTLRFGHTAQPVQKASVESTCTFEIRTRSTRFCIQMIPVTELTENMIQMEIHSYWTKTK